MKALKLSELHLNWGACRYQGNTYRSYSLAKAVRKNGKNGKEIVVKLGKLDETEASRWRAYLAAIKKSDFFVSTLPDLIPLKHYNYLDVAVVNALWDEWQLDKPFGGAGKRKISVADIARILTIGRCLDPLSKSQSADWFGETALPWILDIKPQLIYSSRIFRDLAVIEDCKEAICDHLFNLIRKNDPDSLKHVFYDLSSTTFSGTRCLLMKWGHCKEGYRNHVVLAVVVNEKGLPFYWEVLPGGTADSTTIAWLFDRLKKRFKLANVTLVFDRGMVSDDNLALIEDEQIKYISAMDRNQIEDITGIKFSMFSHLDPEQILKQVNDTRRF